MKSGPATGRLGKTRTISRDASGTAIAQSARMHASSTAVETLRSEELVAAILVAGMRRSHTSERKITAAREVAAQLLTDLGGIGGLGRSTPAELRTYLEGEGVRLPAEPAALAIAAAFELGRRAVRDTSAPPIIRNSADVAAWAMARLVSCDHEELWLLALDGLGHVRAVRRVAKGGLHGMSVCPSDPLRFALRAGASGFVLVHNHPSGDPSPSQEDLVFTHKVALAAAVVGVPLLDHVVVAFGSFASVPLSAMEPPVEA